MASHNWEKYFDVNSEYWTKLQKLYEINDNYPKTKVRGRELHHKFLRCFSRVEGAPIDNDKENLVSLSCGDHFLAHYYIWKCTNKGFRRYTCRPVMLMYRKSLKYITDETAEHIATDWADVVKSYKHSEETRERMSTAHKGKHFTEETREKMSEANKGKHLSEETRKKLSEARKGRAAWNKGKHFTEETREKMSEAQKGKPKSEETRRKLSEARKGKHWKLVDGKRVYY